MTEEKADFGMTGEEIFRAMEVGLEVATNSKNKDDIVNFSHMQMLWLHARALSAHCECLGMNAENMWSAIANQGPAYKSEHYFEVMQKYGLVDEKGESII